MAASLATTPLLDPEAIRKDFPILGRVPGTRNRRGVAPDVSR